jgi:hypothetical protein
VLQVSNVPNGTRPEHPENPEDREPRAADPKPHYGVGRTYLESLPAGSVVAYRGEPTAIELAMLRYSMDTERQVQFESTVSDVVHHLRAMTQQQRQTLLTRLGSAAEEDGTNAPIVTEALPQFSRGFDRLVAWHSQRQQRPTTWHRARAA